MPGRSSASFSVQSLAGGHKNFIVDKGEKVHLSVIPGSQLVHFGHEKDACSYDKVKWREPLAGKRVRQAVCAMDTTLFVCEDETLYSVGTPLLFKDANQHSKTKGSKTFTEI